VSVSRHTVLRSECPVPVQRSAGEGSHGDKALTRGLRPPAGVPRIRPEPAHAGSSRPPTPRARTMRSRRCQVYGNRGCARVRRGDRVRFATADIHLEIAGDGHVGMALESSHASPIAPVASSPGAGGQALACVPDCVPRQLDLHRDRARRGGAVRTARCRHGGAIHARESTASAARQVRLPESIGGRQAGGGNQETVSGREAKYGRHDRCGSVQTPARLSHARM
jgi:hypothetical protein